MLSGQCSKTNRRKTDDDVPLCPGCLAKNSPRAHFCYKCNAPLTSHAATDPLGHIFALGYAFGKATSRPRSRIVLVGLWLVCGPIFLGNLPAVWYSFLAVIYPVFHFEGMGAPDYNFATCLGLFLLAVGIETVFLAIPIKATLNYRRGD